MQPETLLSAVRPADRRAAAGTEPESGGVRSPDRRQRQHLAALGAGDAGRGRAYALPDCQCARRIAATIRREVYLDRPGLEPANETED